MLLVVSLPRFPQKWAVRILTGWYWIYCILIVVAYRASLTAILANPVPRVTIDTLQELANGPIGCGAWGEQNRQFFATSSDDVSHKIGAKIELINTAEEAVRTILMLIFKRTFLSTNDLKSIISQINRVSQGKFAYYENEYFLKELRFKHDQIEANKLKYLHIMEECAINMPISIGLEKNSPLKPSFDRLLRQVMEAGLISKWLSDSIQRFEASIEESPQEALMDLKKLYGVLFAVLVGFSIALLALIGENLYWRFVTKKNPLYDKYDPMKLYQ